MLRLLLTVNDKLTGSTAGIAVVFLLCRPVLSRGRTNEHKATQTERLPEEFGCKQYSTEVVAVKLICQTDMLRIVKTKNKKRC